MTGELPKLIEGKETDDKTDVSVEPAEVLDMPVGELRLEDVAAVAPMVEADIVSVELNGAALVKPVVEENMLEEAEVKIIDEAVVTAAVLE